MFKKKHDYKQFIYIAIGLIIAAFITFGYVSNIVALFGAGALTGEVVIRTIGIFAFPLGVIMGFF
jgi:hypothetical protein